MRRQRHQQRLPPESELRATTARSSPLASSAYHGLHVSFVQRPTRLGFYRVSYTLSKAMDDVGQFFFSSPIDPFDLSKDWARSDNDQRHRLVVNAGINSPMEPATTAWQHLTHGFQLSGVVQYYSALPLNITSGVTTVQGTTGRPIVDGAFISRNAGVGPGVLQPQPPAQPHVPLQRPRAPGGARRKLQPDEPHERRDDERQLRIGRVSHQPVTDLRTGEPGVSEPRTLQFGVRCRF